MFQKPLLPDGFLLWTDPPDDAGDETLHIVSHRRALALKGRSFREFARSVAPMLDGAHDIEEIRAANADAFAAADIDAAIAMLAAQGIVVEGSGGATPARLAPQLNYFGEMAAEGRGAQARLAAARVVVFGLGGPGAAAARALAAAGVGRLTLVDATPATATDDYYAALFAGAAPRAARGRCVAERLAALAPEIVIDAPETAGDAVEDVEALLDGADLALCCLESAQLNLALKLNRAARARRVRWLAGALEGGEIVVGPGFAAAGEGPCYMCWRMREVSCAANPGSRFSLERRLDQLRRDLGDRREAFAPAADILGGMMALEALNVLSGLAAPALDGRLITLDLRTLAQTKHTVLRKPGCPVCDADQGSAPA